jgi:hypothetical protein
MWRRSGDDEGRGDRRSDPVLMAGSNFLQNPLVRSRLGRGYRRGRRLGGPVRLAKRMLPSGGSAGEPVTCIACGTDVARAEAREYDKQGDRWDRADKRFEHLCRRCHGDLSHQPRGDLEPLLVEFEAGDASREEFLSWYCDRVEERYGPLDEE